MKTIILSLQFVFLFVTGFAQHCDTIVTTADPATFKMMIEKHDGVLIDVRTPEEMKEGYINGAINIDFRSPEFESKIAKLDKTKTYYLYCATGMRSDRTAKYMLAHGICKVIVLNRGIHAWNEEGFPLVKPK